MDGDDGACEGNWLELARELRRAALRVSCRSSSHNVGATRVLSRTASRLEQTFSPFRHCLFLLSSPLSSYLIFHYIRFPTVRRSPLPRISRSRNRPFPLTLRLGAIHLPSTPDPFLRILLLLRQ